MPAKADAGAGTARCSGSPEDESAERALSDVPEGRRPQEIEEEEKFPAGCRRRRSGRWRGRRCLAPPLSGENKRDS